MAGDAALRKELLEILAEPAGPVPEVRAGKPALRERRALPSPSLAETSLAFEVDLPVLPFTKPAPGAPPPVFAPSPAPAPAASLGETKLALGGVDKPVLPFAKREAEVAPPEGPAVKPAAVAIPETTAPAFKVDLPAIPFTKAAPPRQELGTTAPAFKVDSPVLPFDKGAPPREASLGETAPAFKVDKPVLPFGEEAKAKEPPQRTPFGVGLGETAPVLRIDLEALPFARSAAALAGPALPEPKLTLEAYATICAEIWLDPPRAGAIAARYGLTAETKPAEDAAWQGRFAGNQALKTAWERLAIEAGQRIRGGK
jgi:hypothetical protein